MGNLCPELRVADLSSVRAILGYSLSKGMRALFSDAKKAESVLLRDPVGCLLSFNNYRWTRSVAPADRGG